MSEREQSRRVGGDKGNLNLCTGGGWRGGVREGGGEVGTRRNSPRRNGKRVRLRSQITYLVFIIWGRGGWKGGEDGGGGKLQM